MTQPRCRCATSRKNFGQTEIIRGVDLTSRRASAMRIIGPNGAGKSTLFNLISGRFPITRARSASNGARIDGLPPYEINRLGLSRSFQITTIFHRLCVFENLRCACCGAAATATRSGTPWAASGR